MVSKVFEKLVNNRIVDHLEKYGFFSDFQYGFRFSRSTVDLLTVDRISRAVNWSGATRPVACDISKAFDGVWHAGLLHKLKSYGISGQVFGLISSILSNRRLWVVLDGKSSQEYPVHAGVPQDSILKSLYSRLYTQDSILKTLFLKSLRLSYYTLMAFLKMLYVLLLSMLIILLSTLSVIRHLICRNI